MKRLQTTLLLVAALLASTAVWADAISPRAQVLKKQLNLTDKQTEEIDKIVKETRAKQKVLREQLLDLSNKQEERVKAVLTAEQKKKYGQLTGEPAMPESPEAPEPETPGAPGVAPEATPQPAE